MSPRHHVDEEKPLVAKRGANDATTNISSYDSVTTDPNNVDDDALQCEPPPPKRRRITKGHFLLFIVAILYGTLNVSLRGIYALADPPSASALSTIRGWLAVLCFAPFYLGNKTTTTTMTTQSTTQNQSSTTTTSSTTPRSAATIQLWRVAAELAIWNFGAQGLVNIGLLYIESARASFFVQSSVVMTPCLAALSGKKVHTNVWWACACALLGLICMSKKQGRDNGQQQQDNDATTADDDAVASFTLGFGDLLCLSGALCWSTYLFRLSAVGDRYDEIHLQTIKTFILAILYSIWCGVEITAGASPWIGWTSLSAWALLFYSALGPGTVADVLQQQGQKTVPASVANIILSLESVFTAVFGRVLLGELTTWMEKVGGCLILTAAIVATWKE